MSGILDSKSRIIDAYITAEGRNQIAKNGGLTIKFATFTDADVFYRANSFEGHDDPTTRIYLEACNLPQDQIVFEADDEGNLVPFRKQDIFVESPGKNVVGAMAPGTIKNGKLVVYNYHHGRKVTVSDILSGIADDKDKGFSYTDGDANISASVLINPSLPSLTVTASLPTGGPYIVHIGTKDGLPAFDFANCIKKAIDIVRNAGIIDASAEVQENFVFLDANLTGSTSFEGSNLKQIGVLSSPIFLDNPALGGALYIDEVEDAAFASQITGILTSSFDNFQQLQMLSTVDPLYQDDSFELTETNLSFDIGKIKSKTLKALTQSPPSLNSIDSLFSDDKLSHLENFMYLPPIVKVSDSVVGDKKNIANLTPYLLGDYPSWGDNEERLSISKLQKQLADYPLRQIIFKNTSFKNNVMGQFFEVAGKEVRKLDIVDSDFILADGSTKKVFFVGKVFLDNRGTTCFVNMFTLTFSKSDRSEY